MIVHKELANNPFGRSDLHALPWPGNKATFNKLLRRSQKMSFLKTMYVWGQSICYTEKKKQQQQQQPW